MSYKQIRPIIVSEGGTGQTTLTNHGVLIGAGTTGITQLGVALTNTALLGNTGLDPSFGAVPNAALVNSSVTLSNGNNITVTGSPLSLGGTASFNLTGTTDHAVQVGNASGSLTSLTVGTTGQILTGVTGANPSFQAPATQNISITGDTGGALVGQAFTFTGGTTGLSFGGLGSTETLTFAGITANGGTVSLATDATTSTLNIGTGSGVKTTTLGSTNSTSTTTVQSGSGALNVTSTNGALTINSGTGVLGISTDASATTVNVATGAAVKTSVFGSNNTTSASTLQSGSGLLTLQTVNGPFVLQSGIGSVSISNDATNTTLNIGTGAGVKTTTLGSVNSTSATTVQSGSGALNVTSTNGALTINSGTGVLGISNDASATTVNIATGGAVKGTTLGSTNSTSATTIQSGSGALTLTTNGGNANIVLTPNGTGVVTTANNLRAASISFDTGTNKLSTFTDWTTYTPTVLGQTTAGTTTYTAQAGFYTRIGNMLFVNCFITYSAATGTGVMLISLPFTVNNTTNQNGVGAGYVHGTTLAYPAGTTNTVFLCIANSASAVFFCSGTAGANGFLQIANTATSINASAMYRI